MSDYAVRAVLEATDRGFTSGMNKATSALSGTESAASSLSSRIKSGLGFGALMAIGQKAVNSISSAIKNNLGNAVKRLDTLNNFPKIMKNLGYSASDAQQAISKMSKGIDGLPTALDDIAGATQKIAPLVGTLDKATDVTLAFNDALLAGGKDAAAQANALEQFSQMLANGKVDMQSWKSMMNAMPGQLNQLAQSLLGPKKNGMDLYEAMKSGKVSFEDFNKALIKLDREGLKSGGKSFASFKKQAQDATKGIGTSITNFKTGIVKGLTTIIGKADGVLHISKNINKLSSAVKDLASRAAESKTFTRVLQGIGNAGKFIGNHVGAITKMAKALAGLWLASKGVGALNSIGASVQGLAVKAGQLVGSVKEAGGVTAAFAGSTTGIGLAAAGAVASVGLLTYAVYKLATQYKEAQNEAKKNAEARQQAIASTDAENGRIDKLYRRLEELNGIEDKSSKQKQEMKSIIDQLNGAVDGLNIKYDEEKGKVEGGTEAIKKRIDAYKEQARTAALQEAMQKAYKDQYENEKKLAAAHEATAKAEEKRNTMKQNGLKSQKAVDAAERKYQDALKKEQDLMKANKDIQKEINGLGDQMKFDTNAFDDLVAKARKAGIDVPAGFVASFKASGKKVPSSVFDLVQQTSPALNAAVTNAKNAGIKIPDSIKAGIESGKMTPAQAIKAINALIDAEEKKQGATSNANGKNAGDQYAKGIESKGGSAKNKAESVAKQGKKGFESVDATKSGSNFSQGFINGIGSLVSKAWSAAKNLAKQAWAGLKKGQAEGSPSKLTMRSGKYFGQGYVLGIKKMRKTAQRASLGLAKAAVDSFNISAPQLNLATAGGGNLRATNQYGMSNMASDIKGEILAALSQRPIVVQPSVEIDGRQVAKTTAVYMQDEQNKLQAREDRRMGIR